MGRTVDGMVSDGPGVSEEGDSNLAVGDRQASKTGLPTGLVTFVMTDIQGSTRLFREVGESYPGLLATHQALLRGPFVGHGGVEVDTEGDSLFFAFPDAAEAVAACLEGQRALAAHPWPPGVEVLVRIGIHTGEAAPVGHGYVDLAVHQVARISAGAHGGQVLVSEAAADAAEGRLPGGLQPDSPGVVPAARLPGARAAVPAGSSGPSTRVPAAAADRRRRSQSAVRTGQLRGAYRGAEGSCVAACD